MELTLEAIVRQVEEIKRVAREGDHECAHGLEDGLRDAVLEAIFNGVHNVRHHRLMAGLALLTKDINFERWAA